MLIWKEKMQKKHCAKRKHFYIANLKTANQKVKHLCIYCGKEEKENILEGQIKEYLQTI